MGLIISFFRRKQSTESVLENLSKQITSLQESRTRCSDLERRLASRLVIYSSVIYVVAAISWYYWGAALSRDQQWYNRLLYTLPFILSPLLLVMLRRFLRWFFVRRITITEDSLKRLENEREEIFCQLMEKETYKRVVELMKKYFPEKLKDAAEGEQRMFAEGGEALPPNASPNRNRAEAVKKRDVSPSQGGSLRHRRTPALGGNPQNGNAVKTTSSQNPSELPQQPGGQPVPIPSSPLPPSQQMPPTFHQNHQLPQLVRPILPQDRSATDRLIDWILGDGLENRYALICANCCSHNGMALREEFEFLAFRCAYCGYFNPAKKARAGASPIPQINCAMVTQNSVPSNGAVDVMTLRRSPSSRHGSQSNLSATTESSNSNDNVTPSDNNQQEADSPSQTPRD